MVSHPEQRTGKPVPPPPPPNTLIVLQTVYHRRAEEVNPVELTSRSHTVLSSDEQAYRRQVKIGTEWQPLDLGWMVEKPIALIVLNNLGATVARTVFPTPQEKEEDKGLVLEVGVLSAVEQQAPEPVQRTMHTAKVAQSTIEIHPILVVHPKCGTQFTPAPGTLYLVRSRLGELKLDLTVIPA